MSPIDFLISLTDLDASSTIFRNRFGRKRGVTRIFANHRDTGKWRHVLYVPVVP